MKGYLLQLLLDSERISFLMLPCCLAIPGLLVFGHVLSQLLDGKISCLQTIACALRSQVFVQLVAMFIGPHIRPLARTLPMYYFFGWGWTTGRRFEMILDVVASTLQIR